MEKTVVAKGQGVTAVKGQAARAGERVTPNAAGTVVKSAARTVGKASLPDMIGKYKITAEIARGGMGVVYKSHHEVLDRDIIIKKMLARGGKEDKERFTREAKILYDMQSPYIVKFLDSFDDGRYRYIVEEFVDGIALDRLLERQTVLPAEVAILVLLDVCYALKFAHSHSVIHRDIKPGNVLISKRGEIKLTDFGIGRVEKGEGEAEVTRAGVMLGTPAYMPPEQFDDSSSVDQRADIYALGVMLYVMVTGVKPYPSNMSLETLTLIKRGKYMAPQKALQGSGRSLPPVVCRLIKKMMKSNAASRFQSVKPIIKACQKYLKHYDAHAIRLEIARAVVSKVPREFKPFVPKDVRKKKAQLIIASAVLLISSFIVLWYEGYIHKSILRMLYTPVDVRMMLPASRLEGSDLPVKAFFFSDLSRNGIEVEEGEDGFPEVISCRRFFRKMKDTADTGQWKGSNRYCTYSIKTAFLRHGNYRVKVVAGPYVWWKSFKVTRSAVLVECDFLKGVSRPISVKPHAYDAQTGEDITKKCRFFVAQNGKWRNIEGAEQSGDMVSGQVWKIKASCKGYEDEVFSLLLDWYQDELYISSSLKKKADSGD